MLVGLHGMKLHAQCYTRSDALCSYLYIECSSISMLFKRESFMLIDIHGLKLYAHCYT